MIAFSQFPFTRGNTDTMIFSLCSYKEGFTNISFLDPFNYSSDYTMYSDDAQFNQYCFNLWTANPEAHRMIIDIMRNVHYGNDVVILIDFSIPYAEYLAETMAGYLLMMYGCPSNIIKEPEDVETIKEATFSDRGLEQVELDLGWVRQNFAWSDLPNDPPD